MTITVHRPLRQLGLVTALIACGAAGSAADVATSVAASDGVVKVGPGGYLTAPPKSCKTLNDRIYKTSDLTGPMLTGQWWSSLVWQPLSQPLFAHPMAMRCVDGGLTIDYPGSKITANEHGIFGSGATKDGDMRLGHSAATSFRPGGLCWVFRLVRHHLVRQRRVIVQGQLRPRQSLHLRHLCRRQSDADVQTGADGVGGQGRRRGARHHGEQPPLWSLRSDGFRVGDRGPDLEQRRQR